MFGYCFLSFLGEGGRKISDKLKYSRGVGAFCEQFPFIPTQNMVCQVQTMCEVVNRSEDILKKVILQYHAWTCCVSNLRILKQRRYSYGFSLAHKSYNGISYMYLSDVGIFGSWYFTDRVFCHGDVQRGHPCVAHVFVIYNTRLILHDHYTRGEHAPLLRCAFYSIALKKMAVPHDTELSQCITPVGSVLSSSNKIEMYTA